MENTRDIQSIRGKGWLALDNAAKLFPAIISKDLTTVFRITASLREPVNYSAICEAVEITSKRFPYFSVSLGSGLFWHFLEFNSKLPRIQPEEETPCTAFAVDRKDEPLYRILVRGRRISVEFVHILTDGTGALEYLKSLLYTYLTIKGKHIGSSGDIILPGSPVSGEEFEDGYKKFFRKLPAPSPLAKAWHLPFTLKERPRYRVLQADMSVSEVSELAKRYRVSITEYFVAVYLFALQEIFIESEKGKRQTKKVLRIELPVNMRNKFESRTMRNFSLFVLPELDMRLGTYSFEEVLMSVHHQLRINSDVRQISRFLSQNVGYEKLFFVRVLPLFIKKLAITTIYKGFASKRFTGVITNLGLVRLPEDMAGLIDDFEIIPPPPNPKVKACIGLVSFGDIMRIAFGNITTSREVEQRILKHFISAGIRVRIINK